MKSRIKPRKTKGSQPNPVTELAQAEATYRGLLEAAPDAIVVVDPVGTISLLNVRAEAQFGYSRDELLGQKVQTIIPEGFAEPLIAAALAREIGTGIELHGRRKDGAEFPMEVMISPVETTGGVLVTSAIRDLSTRKAVQARLEFQMEEIRALNAKLSATLRSENNFLANMSHEIRTPMNAIMGMTHLALRTNPNPKQHGYLTIIDKSSRALLRILNNILDFSKIEAHEMELECVPFLLDEVLKDLNDIVGQAARAKNLPISISVAEGTPRYLRGDPLRLGQILNNLLGNAIKFTESGEIAVRVRVEHTADEGDAFVFSVRDTGIGMTPEQIAKVFRPFNQADTSTTRTYGGTGLGLSISKQLCALMGGSLNVESEIGKGTVFTLRMKFELAPGGLPVLPGTPHLPLADLKQRSVLVVDDSENAREVLVAMLEANGVTARAVASGEEALLTLRGASALGETFDLVLMDWKMPRLNGIETSYLIQCELQISHIPAIVMISAFERGKSVPGATEPKLDGFLIKPVKEAQLIDTISRIFDGESAGSLSNARLTALQKSSLLIGRRVLLVDDNEINCDLAGELLADLGIVVTIAVNGREAVERAAAQDFDLILMDIQMPVMDGLVAARKIRASGQEIPIIAMTAHALDGDRKRSLEAGMNDHLSKPFSPDNLREILIRWMSRTQVKRGEPVQAGLLHPLMKADTNEPGFPFDLKAALARTNGKPELLQKMMSGFRNKFTDAMTNLRSFVTRGKAEEAERLAHTLKGVAATLEANELRKAAAAVENAFRENRTDNLDPLLSGLELALDQALAAVDSLHPVTAPRQRSAIDAVISVSSNARTRILVVDDDVSNMPVLMDMLGAQFEVVFEHDGMAALAAAASTFPDVIVLDVLMPGIDGFEVCKRLKLSRATQNIPVIFLTAMGDAAAETRGFECGAADFINKPITPATFLARINNQIALKNAHDRLIELAMTDPLTGLSNRRHFDEMINYEYARHVRSKRHLSLIMIDVDYFKAFNDNYGHVAGDDCLRLIAQAIEQVIVRATDLAARYGGEEFVVLLPETNLQGALLVADKIQKAINELGIAHSRSNAASHITVSLGVITGICIQDRSMFNFLAEADQQLYAAKTSGRNRICSGYVMNESAAAAE